MTPASVTSAEIQKTNDTEKKNVLNLDSILIEEVGTCGKFQILVLAFCCFVALYYGQSINSYLFTIAQIKTRCFIPECENSSTSSFNLSPPWIFNAIPTSDSAVNNCHRYEINASSTNTSGSCSVNLFDRNSLIKCESYVYEHENSAVYEYDLACDEWRPSLIGFVNVLGLMVSLPVAGFVADRWGRRVALASSAFNLAWIGSLKYFASSYNSFFLISFAESVFGASSFSCAYILVLEYVGPKHRVLTGTMINSFASVGRILLSLTAWSQIYWRNLILVIHVPLCFTLAYFWIAPESIRWLMSKGRYEEAKDLLKKAAKINGNCLSEKTFGAFSAAKEEETKESKKSEPWLVCLVFSHPPILLRCLITSLWWVTSLLVFHGLSLSSVGVSGNRYVNFCAAAFTAILAYSTTFVLLNVMGRKPLLFAGFWLCGVCQCAYIFIPAGHYWLSLCVYMTGVFFSSSACLVVYVYTAELYPTRYRARLFAFSSMVGRVGNLLAPLAPALAAAVWQQLPFALFGGMALLSGLLVLLAPETLGQPLPDTMEEAVALGKSNASPFRWLFRKKCYNVN